MKKLAMVLVLAAVIVLSNVIVSCSKKKTSSPSSPGEQETATAPAGATLTPVLSMPPTATITRTATITPTATVAPTNTAVVIYAYLEVNDDINGIYADEEIVVKDNNNNPITTAGVTIKDISQLSQINVPYYPNYDEYYVESPAVNPGDMYEVDVCVNGVTYSAQSVMPGPAQIDAEGNTVSWQSKCYSDSVTVYNPDGTQAFNQSDSGSDNNPTSADISSVYATSGQYGEYTVDVQLEDSYSESNGAFTGTSQNSYINLNYGTAWSVYVEPGSQNAGTPTSTPTPVIQIYANIYGNDQEGGMSANEYVYVFDGAGNAITNAAITIKDLTAATQAGAPNNGGSYYYVQNPAYIPGDNYEVDVLYKGITYTAHSVAPGPAQIDAEGNTVSWQNGGNNGNSVSVTNPDGTQAFSQSDSGTDNGQDSVDISSVYAASGQDGQYMVNTGLYSYIPESNSMFTGASSNSYLALQYNVSWDVDVTSGSQTVTTPSVTPTPALRIVAYINGSSQSGGAISSNQYVYVYDGNNNAITNAGVIIKDITAATQVTLTANGNDYYIQSPVYNAGHKYEVDVLYSGATYTAQAIAPGPAQMDAGGNTVTWQNSGNSSNSVSVINPNGTQAFSQSDSGTDNTSGEAVIAAVYSKSGQYGEYQVNVNLSSYFYGSNGAFAGTSQNSYFSLQYSASWNVNVTAGSQGVATPTATPFIKIYAYINESQSQTGGISTSEYVSVMDMGNNLISTASVTIKNLTAASQVSAPYNGGQYTVQNPVYVPGDKYEVDVLYAGVTYTAQSVAPGAAQISPSGGTLSWQNNGNNNNITVENPDSSQAFYQSDSGNDNSQNSVNLSTVYATSGQYGEYIVNIDLESDNYENAVTFAGTSPNSYFYTQYSASWEVFVTSGAQVVGTPTSTPTATPTP